MRTQRKHLNSPLMVMSAVTWLLQYALRAVSGRMVWRGIAHHRILSVYVAVWMCGRSQQVQ